MKSGTDQQKIESNLTRSEQASLKILQKGVESGELIITETDKSGKFCVLRRDQYLQSGAKHTSGDLEVEWEQVQSIQKAVNDHCKWIRRIFGFGVNWNHEDRFSSNMSDRWEIVAPLYLLVKDHKGWRVGSSTPPPSRPVCSGNQGLNRHIRQFQSPYEAVSMVLESVCHAIEGNDIDSPSGLLEKLDVLNKESSKEFANEPRNKSTGEKDSNQVRNTTEIANCDKIKTISTARNRRRDGDVRFGEELKQERIKNLRNMRSSKNALPNFRAKLWATRLLGEQMNGESI